MRKTVFGLIGVLLVFFIALSLVSRNRDYRSEKLLYRANKAFNKTRLNRDATPEKMLLSIESDFKKIIEKFPEGAAAKNAYVKLTEFYLDNKKYDDAILTSDKIMEKYKADTTLACQAQFVKARAYEKKGDWKRTIASFEKLEKDYANTPIALHVPLYIAESYQKKGDAAKAKEEIGKAIQKYRTVKDEKKNTLLGYIAISLLTQTYISQGRFEEAGNSLEETVKTYTAEPILAQQMPLVEFIFVKNLKRPEKAIEIYQFASERISNENQKQVLKRRINELKE